MTVVAVDAVDAMVHFDFAQCRADDAVVAVVAVDAVDAVDAIDTKVTIENHYRFIRYYNQNPQKEACFDSFDISF